MAKQVERSDHRDMRERLAELEGRIISAKDMVGISPLDLSLNEYAARTRRFPSMMRLYPIQPGRISERRVHAVVDRGAWTVECPFCMGSEYADPSDPRFLCTSCWNELAEGKPLAVVFPSAAEQAAIEVTLVARPRANHRRWRHGMTPAAMADDYVAAQVSGTPTNQNLGDLITSAIYNARVGGTGSDLWQMWALHDHGTAVGLGDGAAILGEEDANGTVAVAEGGWTTLASVGFTPLEDDVILLLAELQVITIDEGGATWAECGIRIERTAGVGGSRVAGNTTVVRRGNNTQFRHNCWALFKAAATGTGAQTFAIQGWQDTDVVGAADNMTGEIAAIRLGKGEIAF